MDIPVFNAEEVDLPDELAQIGIADLTVRT